MIYEVIIIIMLLHLLNHTMYDIHVKSIGKNVIKNTLNKVIIITT